MTYLILILIFVTITLLSHSLLTIPHRPHYVRQRNRQKLLVRIILTSLKFISNNLARFKILSERRQEVWQAKILRAGWPRLLVGVSAYDLLSSMILGAIGLPLLFSLAFGGLRWFWIILLAGIGFWLPYQIVNDRIARRQRKIFHTLPDFLDLLVLSVEAGLDLGEAIKRVIKRWPDQRDPLIKEFHLLQREISFGKTQTQAFRDLSKRIDQPDLSRVVDALVQSREMGTPIGKALETQAAEIRNQRFLLAEKMAGETPVKILFPLIIFIFPSVLIILLAPVLLQFLQTGLF